MGGGGVSRTGATLPSTFNTLAPVNSAIEKFFLCRGSFTFFVNYRILELDGVKMEKHRPNGKAMFMVFSSFYFFVVKE